MPQPLYRYTPGKGAVDGALFALAQGNDPEILLLLELAPPAEGAPPAWRYAVARMSSQTLRLRVNGKEVWTAESYWNNPRSPEDPYQEEPDGKYPGALDGRPLPKQR